MPAVPLARRAARAGIKRASSVREGLARSARSSGGSIPPNAGSRVTGMRNRWNRQSKMRKGMIAGGGVMGAGMLFGGGGGSSSGRTGRPPARSSGGSMMY